MSTWQDFQESSSKTWSDYYDKRWYLEKSEKTFKALINTSKSIDISNFEITCSIDYADIDMEIKTKYGTSFVFVSFAMNSSKVLWWFLEALLTNNEEFYFFCDEEGPFTFFYVKELYKNKIRFIHISDRVQNNGLATEDFKIRQDFVIEKNILIKIFFEALCKIMNNDFKKAAEKIYYLRDYTDYVEEAEAFKENYDSYLKKKGN